MHSPFTKESVTQAMEQCQWYPREQFVLTADLKPKVLRNALANIAPELRKEDVVAVRDDTFLRSGKVGWILTSDKIYFHKDYKLFSDPHHTHFIDFSRIKSIQHWKKTTTIRLTYIDDTTDTLDCSIDSIGDQIAEFFSCIIKFFNAGCFEGQELTRLTQLVRKNLQGFLMAPIFPRYPGFIPADDLPEKKIALLKKFLQNPFIETIMAFKGNVEPNIAYGHLFTTHNYYFLFSGRVVERIDLLDLEDIYPHHSDNAITIILKDGTVKPLIVDTSLQDDLEAIFEEICISRHHDDVRGEHMRESAEDEERRTRIVRKMSQLRSRDIPRPYGGKGHRSLIELARKLEAAGESEELPFVYEQLGFISQPPEDSYFRAKAWLSMPLSRFALSYVYYYLHCLKRNVRFCDSNVRRYENPEYRAFIEMCNTTPLTEVREKLVKELKTVRSWLEDAKILNFSGEDIP